MMQRTSLAAYRSVQADGTIAHQKQLILKALEQGSGNAYEISLRIPLDKHCVGRRISELAADGKIEPTGEQRITDTNRKAAVWQGKREGLGG